MPHFNDKPAFKTRTRDLNTSKLLSKPAIRFFFTSMVGILLASPLSANDSDWQKWNMEVVDHYIIPRYQQLADESASLASAAKTLCKTHKDVDFYLAQKAFNQTMDAWQAIQAVKFGPVALLMRGFSIQFWPDKKNHTGRQLRQLIQRAENAMKANTITTENLSELTLNSVSVKGIPAIERLLYHENALTQLETSQARCLVLQRISEYLSTLSNQIVNDWRGDMRNIFKHLESEAASEHDRASEAYFAYESVQEASTDILKTFVEQFEYIRDAKLLRAMGSDFRRVKVSRLESPRSLRSLRNIQINIDALKTLYAGTHDLSKAKRIKNDALYTLFTDDENKNITAIFREIDSALINITNPMEHAITTPAGYKAMKHLANKLKEMDRLLQQVMINHGIVLGFNSRDGD